ADTIYLWLSEQPYSFGEDLDRERRAGYAADRSAIGIELTCVSMGVDLRDLPARDEIARLLSSLNIEVFA
ncbi:MAG TPA: DUF2283 domain-containing protein, partial [Dehalococcoidia bacterium]|nr:DUF2283 domain-containing protein [Dehalococcoidia bacterium]